jgi:hypothetical protein
MIFTIPVTAAHIAKGKPQEACDCPVWHAIAETLPWLVDKDVTVGPADIVFFADSDDAPFGVAHIELAGIARVAISDFDNGRKVEPFEFTLDIPGHLVPVTAGGEPRA